MKREPGFYWVETHRGWVVAEWVTGERMAPHWRLTSSLSGWSDKEFKNINETKLERP